MTSIQAFNYEWIHFTRSPFKVIALLLFITASIYGLHNGASLYNEQFSEINRIKDSIRADRQPYLDYYDQGKVGPESRPWIDIGNPFWAIWYNQIYHFKEPSKAVVFNIGQAEQYGFYKKVTFRAGPYDADMSSELANPERLQVGSLDFGFTLLYLSPLLLLILLYNIKSTENETGILSLIEVQAGSRDSWLLGRVLFYILLVLLTLFLLIGYGSLLNAVTSMPLVVIGKILLLSAAYILFWSVLYYFILTKSMSILGNTLKMVGLWLIFAFIIPAAVHQWVSVVKPANLMTDLIDAKRDERQAIFQRADSLIQADLNALFPEILDSPAMKKGENVTFLMNRSGAALQNELNKQAIASIEADFKQKNAIIEGSFWFNPVAFFQNQLNRITETHFDDYQSYRDEVQLLVDKQIRTMVLDLWNDVKVDKAKYEEYHRELSMNKTPE